MRAQGRQGERPDLVALLDEDWGEGGELEKRDMSHLRDGGDGEGNSPLPITQSKIQQPNRLFSVPPSYPLHSHNLVARIDIDNLPSDTAGQVTTQESRGIADFQLGDGSP